MEADIEETKQPIAGMNGRRFAGGIILIGVCIVLDIVLHMLGMIEKGYSHPHGPGSSRVLFGWLAAWAVGWVLMRWYISFRVRRFGPKEYGHFGRARIWAGFALFVLLVLPT